jgi:hypothetical protein
MNPPIDRRKFLASAAVGGATIVGASALGGLDPAAAFADPTPSLDPGIDPVNDIAFAEGRVTQIKGSALEVAGSHGDQYILQITNGTSIWKVHPTNLDAIEIGDGLYARGVDMPDGTIAPDAVWVNIVNLQCTISAIGRDQIQLDHNNNAVAGNVLPGTTTVSYLGGAQTPDLSGLKIGQAVQVLGAWRPADDSVDLVTLWAGH